MTFAWPAAVPAAAQNDLASRFATAPDSAPDQQQLVQIKVNGISYGDLLIHISHGNISLPAATVHALGLNGHRGQSLELSTQTVISYRFVEQQGMLTLSVPVDLLSAQHFAPDLGERRPHLSPETWGAYANYDLNVRHEFAGDVGSTGAAAGSASYWGGDANLRLLAPDFVGGFGWAYDSERPAANALIRLDSTLSWRPRSLDIAISAGDVISTTSETLAQARPWRFGGVQIGTDFSGVPGWSSSPIPSVTGTAQAQSAIDVYLDGQRTYHTDTAGGPFSLVLPPGSTGEGTNVVVTDVTGRSVLLPVEVQRADTQLLRRGLFLWSAGVGAPRFGYGASETTYDGEPYFYSNGRYGISDRLTASTHLEGGPDLGEFELASDLSVLRRLGVHASVAGSESGRGAGAAGRFGFVLSGPWNFDLELDAAHTAGSFDDVVSASARTYGRNYGTSPIFSLPATSEFSALLSWQTSKRLSLSASYASNKYPGSSAVGFASLSANYLALGRIPVFANLSEAMGGQRSTTLEIGVSLSFGRIQAAISGGYGSGGGGLGGAPDQSGYTGTASASQPLSQSIGAIGWNLYANRTPTSSYEDADASVRTGDGIAGVAVQSFGKQVTTLATLQGSAGVIGMHPFAADPATGGIIIADAGRPGVPVELNGYEQGRTAFDGKMAIAGAVADSPQTVAIDASRMPIDAVPTETDQQVTVRNDGATIAKFGVASASASALLHLTYRGAPPPVGSILSSSSSSAPISKEGRAYLPSLRRNEVLKVEMPDGTSCTVATKFDGKGGVGRRLGSLPCLEVK